MKCTKYVLTEWKIALELATYPNVPITIYVLMDFFILIGINKLRIHWCSSHYAVMHMQNTNSNIQGRSPYAVNVIVHVIRNSFSSSKGTQLI